VPRQAQPAGRRHVQEHVRSWLWQEARRTFSAKKMPVVFML